MEKTIIKRLHELFDYNPDTGIMTKKASSFVYGSRLRHASRKRGYLSVIVDGQHMQLHRVAWALHYGRFPKQLIDHRNGNPHDNRIENLREATHSENAMNAPRKSGRVSKGPKGVFPHLPLRDGTPMWRACIQADGQWKHLGRFRSEEAALEAYIVAALTLHGEFARF